MTMRTFLVLELGTEESHEKKRDFALLLNTSLFYHIMYIEHII